MDVFSNLFGFGCCPGSGGGGSGGTVVVPNCFCDPLPATLTMTSADPKCNYGMYQTCSIVYGPTPSGYLSLDFGLNAYLSTESFPDVIGDGALFQYLFSCQYNQFYLSRVYLSSPYGSPYRDGILFSWTLGASGNTCTPFQLLSGSGYSGSLCGPNVVTISG